MDTQKLRQRILDLAIRGKLLPQDPNDEPASVLLDRIRAEKERLIAEGKLKRPKAKKSTDKSHYQKFEIPDTWVWTTLGEIFSMQAGKSIHSQDLSSFSEDCPYPCYGGNGIRGFLPIFSHQGTYPIIGRQGALCGNINIAQGPFYATEHAVVVESFANTNTFLWAFFLEYLNLNQYATSTAQPGLSVAKIEEVPIPLPPIEEQERIVSKIHKWFGLIEHIGNATTSLLDTISLTKSKILDLAMQGKLVPQEPSDEPAADMLRRINPKAKIITDNPHSRNLPTNWILCRFGDIADISRGGSPRPIKSYITNDCNGINWIKIGDADGKYINSTKEKIIPAGVKMSREVKKGEILLTNSMSFGKPYILNINGCIHDGWLVLSPKGNSYDKDFLYYLLSSKIAYSQFAEQAGGAVVSNLNSDKVANTLFPLLSISEQQRIVGKIEELYSVLDEIEASLQS